MHCFLLKKSDRPIYESPRAFTHDGTVYLVARRDTNGTYDWGGKYDHLPFEVRLSVTDIIILCVAEGIHHGLILSSSVNSDSVTHFDWVFCGGYNSIALYTHMLISSVA